jgi:hypothetical protein
MSAFTVLRGQPDDEELAALVAVLTTLTTLGRERPAPAPVTAPAPWVRPAGYSPPGAWVTSR